MSRLDNDVSFDLSPSSDLPSSPLLPAHPRGGGKDGDVRGIKRFIAGAVTCTHARARTHACTTHPSQTHIWRSVSIVTMVVRM